MSSDTSWTRATGTAARPALSLETFTNQTPQVELTFVFVLRCSVGKSCWCNTPLQIIAAAPTCARHVLRGSFKSFAATIRSANKVMSGEGLTDQTLNDGNVSNLSFKQMGRWKADGKVSRHPQIHS
jgi:hypothetical protein